MCSLWSAHSRRAHSAAYRAGPRATIPGVGVMHAKRNASGAVSSDDFDGWGCIRREGCAGAGELHAASEREAGPADRAASVAECGQSNGVRSGHAEDAHSERRPARQPSRDHHRGAASQRANGQRADRDERRTGRTGDRAGERSGDCVRTGVHLARAVGSGDSRHALLHASRSGQRLGGGGGRKDAERLSEFARLRPR